VSEDNNLKEYSRRQPFILPGQTRNIALVNYTGCGLPAYAIALLSGVCFLQLQPDLSTPVWTSSELLLFLPLCFYLFFRNSTQRFVISFFIGYFWALLFGHMYLYHQLPNDWEGKDVIVQGFISDLPELGEKSVRFNFEVTDYRPVSGGDRVMSAHLPSRIRLSWYYSNKIVHSGDKWQFVVRLKKNHGMQNPGGFDYETWLYQKGIHAGGYIRKNEQNKRLSASKLSIDHYRQVLSGHIEKVSDSRFHGILQALTLGHKALITPQQWQVLRNTGTSHLMAISGLHIGLVSGMVFFAVRRFTPAFMISYISSPQLAAIFSLFAAFIYAMLAGFSVPTQRAFVMLLVFMSAILFMKPAFSLNTLSVSVIAVLLFSPLAVLSAGFWLSYLAVLIIFVVSYGRIYSKRAGIGRWFRTVRLQWLIALGMLPISLLLFNQGSVISPLANMLVIPVIALLVVPLALLASVISVLSVDISLWLFSQASQLISLIWFVLEWFSGFELSSWGIAEVSLINSLSGLIGLVLLLMPKGFPMRLSGLVLLVPMLFQARQTPDQGEFWMTVLDVGQGLSVLVQTKNQTLLYDAGAKYSEHFDLGQRVVLPYLQYRGVTSLDAFVISHSDNDHAGGAQSILNNMPVSQLYAEPGIVNSRDNSGGRFSSCVAGDNWVWSGVNFLILHPTQEMSGINTGKPAYVKTNNRSCVIKIWNASNSVLLTGDIERRVESELLKRNASKLASDVLVVPHHGSNTSSSRAWLDVVRPTLAIVSAGYRNRFNHPTQKVLQRYHQLGSRVMNTANEGAIHMQFKPELMQQLTKIRGRRKVSAHYWNHGLR